MISHNSSASPCNPWQAIGQRSHHGIALPLFALHTANRSRSTFLDLIPVIQWCAKTGLDTLQLLPINDTGKTDSPYSLRSAFALHPRYLDFCHLPFAEGLSHLPLSNITSTEDPIFHQYLRATRDQFLACDEYRAFCLDAQFWLSHYLEGSAQGEEEQTRMSIVQFLCDRQMRAVKKAADTHSVFLMGDLPLFVDPNSVDVRAFPSLFERELSVGAPPDQFNAQGQHWGFPPYAWTAMRKEGYLWWKRRLQWAARYYHIYRIDHIVGLFRVWTCSRNPQDASGKFLPGDPALWIAQGRELLNMMLSASEMLPIGEDLGIIPNGVRETMRDLSICRTQVMRWERRWHDDGSYIPLEEYEPFGITTVATHDSESIREWWKNDAEAARRLSEEKGWCYHPILSRNEHEELLWDSHHTSSFFHVNPIQEYFSLLPDLSWHEEARNRINIPGTTSDHNWRYQTRAPIELWTQHQGLQALLRRVLG